MLVNPLELVVAYMSNIIVAEGVEEMARLTAAKVSAERLEETQLRFLHLEAVLDCKRVMYNVASTMAKLLVVSQMLPVGIRALTDMGLPEVDKIKLGCWKDSLCLEDGADRLSTEEDEAEDDDEEEAARPRKKAKGGKSRGKAKAVWKAKVLVGMQEFEEVEVPHCVDTTLSQSELKAGLLFMEEHYEGDLRPHVEDVVVVKDELVDRIIENIGGQSEEIIANWMQKQSM